MVCDVSCSIDDLKSPLKRYGSVEVVCDKECKKEYENVASNTISSDDKNVGWNIMKQMGYKGKGLGKYEQGNIEPILPTMKPKYEGLGYATDERNDVIGSRKISQSKKYMQCSSCDRKGHTKDKCWDLHPCNICGLKSHSDKTCWNKDCKNDSMAGYIKMDCGWSYGSSW